MELQGNAVVIISSASFVLDLGPHRCLHPQNVPWMDAMDYSEDPGEGYKKDIYITHQKGREREREH